MAHSSHGFSGQYMIMSCAGSVDMQEGLEDETNPAAEKGTAVHECGERALLYGIDAVDLVGHKFNGFKMTAKMVEAAQEYVDYVRKIMSKRPNARLLVEQKVVMSSVDASRLWGTSDAVIINLEHRELIIGDYKNGYGVVDIDKTQYIQALDTTSSANVQIIGYALATLDTFELWDKVDHVTGFISQPNKDHVDGTFRHHSWSISEMHEWREIYRKTHALATSDDAPRKAGSWCQYCRARGHCGTRITDMISKLAFDKPIRKCTPDQLIGLLDDLSAIKNTCDAINDQVTLLARNGIKVPNRKLVRSIVRAKCSDEDSLISEALTRGIDEDDLYNKRLKGKTDIKTIIGTDLANKYFVTPERGYTLVPMSDTRPAVMADKRPDARGRFKKVER